MWKAGAMLIKGKVYKFQVKIYKISSKYGIDEGKIFKAYVSRDGVAVINYNRGWALEPVDEDAALALEILMKEYN